MHKIYDKWPEIAKDAYETKYDSIEFKEIDNIVFAGMGGSGAIGDIISSILSKKNIHVSVVKGYVLPKTVDQNTLVITTSISGNTVETLTILDSAKNLDCKLIGFSSGGKMFDYCKKYSIEHRKLPYHHSPRASFPSFLYGMLKTLEHIMPIEKVTIQESIHNLKNLQNIISSENINDENPALNIAEWIEGIPQIYYPFGLQAAAIRFKNSLQENSKIHAMTEDVIETCHNGIVSWEKESPVKPLMIIGKDDYNKTKERWKILKEFFKSKTIDFKEINSIDGDILSKLIHLIYLFDYTSIYKAVITKIDPSPIKPIDFVKSRL